MPSSSEHAIEQAVPHAVRNAHLIDERLVPAVVVEQLALGGVPRQRLELMLAVDIDEDVPELAQQRRPARTARSDTRASARRWRPRAARKAHRPC